MANMRGLAVADDTTGENLENDLREALEGNREAFDRVITGIETKVMKTALFLLRNVSDAEDAAQEVYVRIFRNLESCRDLAHFERWVYRITVNTCRDLQRRRRLWFPLTLVRDAIRPPDAVVEAELGGRLMQGLKRLTLNERAAFVLRELEELDTAEVAEILSCSPVTVRGYLHDARKKLQRQFRDLREK